MTRGDAKMLTRAERYGSPEAVFEALVHAQNRISSGELKPSLPAKDATTEQVKEWRAANGVPETAEGYGDLGLQLSEAGKATLSKYLPIAHAANLTPDQVRANLQFLSTMTRDQMEGRATKDREAEDAAQNALRSEWGAEYRRNNNIIQNLLDGRMKPEVKQAFMGARLPDGTPLGSSPDMMRVLLGLALIDNPAGTIVPGAGGDPMKGVEQELAEIRKVMSTDRKRYNGDEKMQARFRELLDAQEKLRGRAQA